jgi:hypothetical protein
MRLAQEARGRAAKRVRQQGIELKQRNLDRKRAALEAQIAVLRSEFEAEEIEAFTVLNQENENLAQINSEEVSMARSRHADPEKPGRNGRLTQQ